MNEGAEESCSMTVSTPVERNNRGSQRRRVKKVKGSEEGWRK